MTVVRVPTAAAMRALGRRLGEQLRPGDLVVLTGDLGAGKTTLTQGVGEALGVREPVRSPTFVVAREHRGGRVPLLHVDAYRLSGPAELDDLDLDTPLAGCATVVEWGAGVAEQLTAQRLVLRLERSTDPDDETRSVHVEAVGQRWLPVTELLTRADLA